MKSFKHEHLFYLHSYMSSQQTLSHQLHLDSLYCGKWRKILKSRSDLDLDRIMPNVELIRALFIIMLQYVQVSSGLNHYFF